MADLDQHGDGGTTADPAPEPIAPGLTANPPALDAPADGTGWGLVHIPEFDRPTAPIAEGVSLEKVRQETSGARPAERPAASAPSHIVRKFASRRCPDSLSTDSGWNWTPCSGSSR